jgi:general stress protein CsbA
MTNLRLEILKAQTEAFLYLYYPVIFLVLFERVKKNQYLIVLRAQSSQKRKKIGTRS